MLGEQFFYNIGEDGYKILNKSNRAYRELNIMTNSEELEKILSLNTYLINNNIEVNLDNFLTKECISIKNNLIHTCSKQKAINLIIKRSEKENKENLTHNDILDNYDFIFVKKCFDLCKVNSILNERLDVKNSSKIYSNEEYKI